MASTYLTRTPSSAGNRRTFTWSFWIKRSSISVDSYFSINNSTDGQNTTYFFITSSGVLRFMDYTSGGASNFRFDTNRLFRDVNAWYHIVVSFDSTQSTSTDRVKIYINGVQETSFSIENYPSQNYDSFWNSTNQLYIGSYIGTSNFYDGSMSHYHFIDGTAYDADTFGETDANGVWKIKTEPSVTYGTNGFFILKDGNSVTDESGNDNDFTVGGGTLTNTEDNPSNVFATLNPLVSITDAPTFSNGNNSIVISNAGAFGSQSTLGMSSGKYYAEFKMTASSDNDMAVGVNSDGDAPRNDNGVGFGSNSTGYRETGNLAVNGTDDIAYGDSYAVNDIVGIAIDLDNNKLYFSKNGTWQNSGDPTSGATGTGALSLTSASSTNSGFYFFNPSCHSGTQGGTWQCNFGNGYFGTTAVSSAGTNASGIGIFEYDVPTGYTALSTKGLNE